MELWVIWLIAVGVLLIIEVLTQMMWALCLAIGCASAIALSLFGVPFYWQIILMAVMALFAYVALVPAFQKWHALSVDKKGKSSRTGMDALLGRRAIISEEVRPDRPGRVRIDGDNWQVKCVKNQTKIPRGTEVVVTGYDSIILEVEPSSSLK
ncbi:MAG: NfeD family protein [Muribaculaceae bacterium]|nr:NfeD family protein [Muribaculaceae bacterium]